MSIPSADNRSPERSRQDEQIANEPPLPPLHLAPNAVAAPMESLRLRRRPIAVNGVVENGLVRPLDPGVHLPENARVIIVAADSI